jgi:hypothetical protein
VASKRSRSEARSANLQAGQIYSWDELGRIFDFPADYLGIAGGMVSRPKLGSLLLITHVQEGQPFSYGDEWDENGDLIYAGRGLTGDQELKAQNRDVAENARDLFLFGAEGRRELYFHGRVRCVEHWESTGYDKNGDERRVYRFRLRRLRRGPTTPKRTTPAKNATQANGRHRSSFQARPFDPERSPAARRQSAPGDPESQKVASEQADKAHQRTLRTFGLWLRENGWGDLKEIDGAIDLLAKLPTVSDGQQRALFEIKSIKPTTERTRVRSGLAQLLEYRLFLGSNDDRLCLVSDRPISERRLRLLDSLSIGHVYVEGGEVSISGTASSRILFPDDGTAD